MTPEPKRWPFASVFLALICLLPTFAGAWYADPPHADVGGHNDRMASALMGVRIAVGGLRPRSDPLRHFTPQVHAVYPSVDQMVSSAHPPRVLWGWSYDAQEEFDWEGSLSGCGSNRSRMRLAGAGGAFVLNTQLGGLSRRFENPSNPAPVGFGSSELASYLGPLSVGLDGRLFLEYARETQMVACRSFCYWNGCSIQSWVETTHDRVPYTYARSSPPFSTSIVVPKNQMVLPTPWIHNASVFLPYLQAYVYSNTSWYRLETRWDGTQTGLQRFLEFDVRDDGRGAWSVWTVSSAFAQNDPVLPARFYAQTSHVYSYAYRIDQSLSNATEPGMHSWSLEAVDVFGDATQWQESLSVHAGTIVTLSLSDVFLSAGQELSVSVRLTDRQLQPLAGKTVRLESSVSFLNLTTDANGKARTRLFLPPGAHRIVARFVAQHGFASSFADQAVYVASGASDASNVLQRYDALLLGLVFVLALCMVRLR